MIRARTFLTLAIGTLAFAQIAQAQSRVATSLRTSATAQAPPEAGGACCVPQANAGCTDTDVETCVCAIDSFCCTTQWDASCVTIADESCGACSFSCCEPHGTPGCDVEIIQDCVCDQDPFCCTNQWDDVCVGRVKEFGCGSCSGAILNDACEDAIQVASTGEFIITTIGATTDGPPLSAGCDEGIGLTFENDIWFCYTPLCDDEILVSMCDNIEDGRLAVYEGCQCPADDTRLVTCADETCGSQAQALFMGQAGTEYLIRTGVGSGAVPFGGLIEIAGGNTTNTDDCNGNSILDGCEIQSATAGDCDVNGVPDACDINVGQVLLQQLPNQAQAFASDSDPQSGLPQSVADDFVIDGDQMLEAIAFWGLYSPNSNAGAADSFTIIVHNRNGTAPGAVVSTQPNLPATRVQTGVEVFGLQEWKFAVTLPNPVLLSAGGYFIEIFNNTTGNPDGFFWETGDLDPLNGLPQHAFDNAETPGTIWQSEGLEMAMQIFGSPLEDCDANVVPDVCQVGPIVLPGDLDGNCTVDVIDYAGFAICFTGTGQGPVFKGCVNVDFDNDDDIDLIDWAALQNAINSPQ